MPDAKKTRKKPTGEITSYEGWRYSGPRSGARFNPDDLIGARGLTVYRKMRLDEQVKAVCNFKRDAIFARGWRFEFDEGSKLSTEEQKRRIDAFMRIVAKIQGAFVDGLNCIATGREFGYSMTEKVYALVDGPTGPLVGISKLLGRDPTTFTFSTDEYGELTKCTQDMGPKPIQIDLGKFIHYVHNPEFDQYFGRSDLREAYKAWFWKTKLLDYWVTYGERLAGGFASIEVDAAANIPYNSPAWSSLESAVNDLSSVSGLVLPPGVKLNLTTPPNSDFYEKAVEFFDLAIARALLVPNLLGVSHTGQTGAYSQSQTQLEAFFWTLNTDKQRMEAALNEQLFKDLGDQNWDDGDYPVFRFKELSSERLKWVVETWAKMISGGAVLPTEADEKYLRGMLEMPERQEGDKQLAESKWVDPVDQQAKLAKAQNPVAPVGKEPPKQMTREDVAEVVTAALKSAGHSTDDHTHEDHSKFSATTRAATRVHFSVIRDRQIAAASTLARDLSAQMAKASMTAIGTDEELTATLSDPTQSNDHEFTAGQKKKLNETIGESLRGMYGFGSELARGEIHTAHAVFSREGGQARPIVFADLRDKAREYFGAKAFRMAGDLSDQARSIIQKELENAIKFGKSPPETRKSIWDALLRKGLVNFASVRETESDELVAELIADWALDEETAAPYLDTLARTNLFEAMNEARYAEFTDPAVAGFVVGLEYSAILDDRTTVICQHLDDKKYASNNALWDTYRPPNHYNCRSVLIPITALDGWDGVESPPPDVEPQEGFK